MLHPPSLNVRSVFPALARRWAAALCAVAALLLAAPALAQERAHALRGGDPPTLPEDLVVAQQKISDTAGGFTGGLDGFDNFGTSAASLGDLDGDGVPDLAVGASNDDDGAGSAGAVWVLFLRADGTVRDHQKISATEGGFGWRPR